MGGLDDPPEKKTSLDPMSKGLMPKWIARDIAPLGRTTWAVVKAELAGSAKKKQLWTVC